MSHPNPLRTGDDRARTHIKALIEETKHQASTAPEPAQTFMSGMMTGLASAVEILNGGTAEGSLEKVAQSLAAAIGNAWLDGQLPAQPPTTIASPTAVMTNVGTPVKAAVTSVDAPPVQCWHTEAGTPCTSAQCNQPDRLRMGDYGDVPNDQPAPPKPAPLLACGLCYEENGEEIHPHPECPVGSDGAALDSRRANICEQLDLVGRGETLVASQAELLRQQVGAEMREADTARAVALGNLRHVRTIVPEMEAQKATIDRVREALRTTFMAGPDAVTVVRASSIRNALNPSKDPS
ncbi:hypothetical protein ACIRQH_19905 [Streptomyces sp. NPDC102279]|uniref:hypothetical protein n=1 Tax=Streptomyces sp. NPDC102279 TaxID=3366153 RepID=UPI0038224A58